MGLERTALPTSWVGPAVPSIYSSARTNLISLRSVGTCDPQKKKIAYRRINFLRSTTLGLDDRKAHALGLVADTDTKLLI